MIRSNHTEQARLETLSTPSPGAGNLQAPSQAGSVRTALPAGGGELMTTPCLKG